MASGNYYGNNSGSNGYGGYRQQPYPSQGYQGGGYGGGDDYNGNAPPASYGETLQQQQQQHQDNRSYSPYSQGSGPGYGQYTPGPTPDGYDRPPPGPPPGRGYSGSGSDRYEREQSYGGPPPPRGYEGYQPQGALQQPGEGERGLLGALAGGAAGAYGGHKVNHGVIGTVGGAVAGSMLEDHLKHRREEEHRLHEQQQQQGRPPPPAYAQHPNRGSFAGNFSASCSQISLDGDFDLIASCGALDGGQRLSSISLNDCLTNEWGHFKWCRGGNFGGSARDVRLVDGGRVLEADLANGSGGWNKSHIFLDEKITNENGELRFLG